MEEWMKNAACRGMDTMIWFPGKGESYRRAVQICARCPVTSACLDYQMSFEMLGRNVRHGVFGGLTPDERHRLVVAHR